jgi:hypothetical protein
MAVTNLEIASAVSDGLVRQHLRDDARATDMVQTARDLVGLHATGAPNPYPAVEGAGSRLRTLDAGPRAVRAGQPGPGSLHARHVVRAAARSVADRLGSDSATGTEHVDELPGLAGTGPEVVRTVGEPDRGPAQNAGAVGGAGALGVGCRPADSATAVLNQMCDEGRLLRDRPVAGCPSVERSPDGGDLLRLIRGTIEVGHPHTGQPERRDAQTGLTEHACDHEDPPARM